MGVTKCKVKYFSSETRPSIAKERLFKVHERIYSIHCYSCFSQEASSDNEYLVIGDLKIHVHNFCTLKGD